MHDCILHHSPLYIMYVFVIFVRLSCKCTSKCIICHLAISRYVAKDATVWIDLPSATLCFAFCACIPIPYILSHHFHKLLRIRITLENSECSISIVSYMRLFLVTLTIVMKFTLKPNVYKIFVNQDFKIWAMQLQNLYQTQY